MDIGIVQVDGTIGKWMDRFGKIKNPSTDVVVINGAAHSFRGYEDQLAELVKDFAKP